MTDGTVHALLYRKLRSEMHGIYYKIKPDKKLSKQSSQCKALHLLRKSCPITCQAGIKGRERYISTHTRPWHENGMGGQHHAPVALPQEQDPAPTVHKDGWALGIIWMGPENLGPTGGWTQDHLACSKSTHKLHYPSCQLKLLVTWKLWAVMGYQDNNPIWCKNSYDPFPLIIQTAQIKLE
jgi:hypothetical protein